MNMRHFKTGLLGITAAVALTVTGCVTQGDDNRTAGRVVDDNAITRNIESNLRGEPVFKFGDVDVKTYSGVVQLSGFVTTDEQKRRAAEIAQNVPGVNQVVNAITLKPQLSPTGRDEVPPVRNISDDVDISDDDVNINDNVDNSGTYPINSASNTVDRAVSPR
jgi:hypothetical protein